MKNSRTHMLIIQVVPKLPPAIDGVGDYALNLARQLRKDFGIKTHFIIGDPNWTGAKQIEGFPVSQVNIHSADTLLSLLTNNRATTVLLHYSGYGYAKRGCPNWLVNGLQRWRTHSTNRRLVTMFHEIYASGPPWASSFWLSPLQKNLAFRLAELSDRIITSKQLYAEILAILSKGKHTQIPVLPVFSSIGEPDKLLPLSQRRKQLVIFGKTANRKRVYQESQAALEYACKHLGIEKILDIGESTRITQSYINKVPILEIGQQPAEKISDILANSVAGFMNYNPDFLAKSSIFASYCAHRLLPINAKGSTPVIDGIEAGKHYWVANTQEVKLENNLNIQTVADNAYCWYSQHSLSKQTKTFSELLAQQ